MTRPILALAATLALLSNSSFAQDAPPNTATLPVAPPIERFLIAGELAKGQDAMEAALRADPSDDAARFGLGVAQFLRGIERVMQKLHEHGLRREWSMSMILDRGAALPIAPNPTPRKISYADVRSIIQGFIDDLAKAEATLAEIRDAGVRLPLRFGLFRMDLNHDGKAEDGEAFWRIFASMIGAGDELAEGDAAQFVIGFDYSDAFWLRGYCRLLSGLCEIALAYDEKELFERTAHVFFPNVDSPHAYLATGPKLFEWDRIDIVDLIAYIHLLNFPVKEPARLKVALEHFEAMIDRSREMWKSVQAESDDEHEWIPNPRQTSVLGRVRVTEEMAAQWTVFLDEARALLAGRKLAPFWRTSDDRGINLRRVFLEPTTFDLVLWIQGTAATPYLERGSLTDGSVWSRLMNVFEGNFVGFAVWFN